MKEFTTAEGLEIQRQHLERFAALLNPAALAYLNSRVEQANKKPLRNGFDVLRGDDLTQIVLNYASVLLVKSSK